MHPLKCTTFYGFDIRIVDSNLCRGKDVCFVLFLGWPVYVQPVARIVESV